MSRNKRQKIVRVYTKVDTEAFGILQSRCKAGGFRSVYQLVQTLIVGFCRYSDTAYDRTYNDVMRREIEEMFETLEENALKRRCMEKGRRNEV